MKNSILLLLLTGIFLFPCCLNAQPVPGLKVGVNYARLSGYNGDGRLSSHAGISMQWSVNKKWKVQPELLYSAEGQRYQAEENEMMTERTVAISFASVPLMLQYFLTSKFYIEAGPQLSFLVGAKDGTKGGATTDVRRNLRNSQFALNAGAGVVTGKRITFYLRYSMGLTDLTLYDNDKDCSRVLQAGLACRFK